MIHHDLSVDDWTFLAEGGAHVVLLNVNSSSPFFGMVLKLPKQPIGNYCWLFLEYSLKNWFGSDQMQYSSVISLDKTFISAVFSKIEYLRPVGRKKTQTLIVPAIDGVAFLERNLFVLNRKSAKEIKFSSMIQFCKSNEAWSMDVAVEIKVKCGLHSVSPFLSSNPYSLIKLKMSRFELMQHYKLAQAKGQSQHQVSWGTFERESVYNPSDLCSTELLRISRAIDALLSNPQNNLRILVDGKHIFGWDKPHKRDVLDFSFAESTGNDERMSIDFFKSAFSSIVHQETLFRQFEALQALDVIDSEGAQVIYNRGLEVMGGDCDKFNCELEQYFSSPVVTYSNHNRITELFGCCLVNEGDFDDSRLKKCNDALEIVASMTLADVLECLRIWMMAYVAKDASIIIPMNFCNENEGIPSVTCLYEPQVIDIGCKSLHKISTRADEDREICRVVCEFLQSAGLS
jgi:hypothetical protein